MNESKTNDLRCDHDVPLAVEVNAGLPRHRAGYAHAHDEFDAARARWAHDLADDCDVDLSTCARKSCHPDDSTSRVKLHDHSKFAVQGLDWETLSGTPSSFALVDRRRFDHDTVSRELRVAAENGDLELEYQPQFDATTCELTGLEALLRWRSPRLGEVPPHDFIPHAEETGLIVTIGDFVLQEVCRQSRRWIDSGCRLVPIAVNFSSQQLRQADIIPRINQVLGSHSIPHEFIEVELTESLALENSARIRGTLHQLYEMGVTMAIDDFGVGHSSLSRLCHFPFHTLKIDRSFVSALGENRGAAAIVEGIISIAHALGMTVVAEGVETQHQLAFLRQHDCDTVQGYLTGRPVSPDRIHSMLS